MKILLRLFLLSLMLLQPCALCRAANADASETEVEPSVDILYFDGTQAQWGNEKDADVMSMREAFIKFKKGMTAMEAVKLAGLEKRLTNNARLEVFPNPDRKDKDANYTIMVDVAAVRAGKAQDVVLNPDASINQAKIKIEYNNFNFSGGTPREFATALAGFYGLDWSLVEIPAELNSVHVPAFRQGVDKGSNPYSDAVGSSPYAVITLYNSIAKRYPAIGQWSWEGQLYKPDIVTLEPDKNAASSGTPGLKVKALPLAEIPQEKWDHLQEDINLAQRQALNYQVAANLSGVDLPEGHTSIQRDSKTLVIIGNQGYIDMVQSLIAAYERNSEVERAQQDKPEPPLTAPMTPIPPKPLPKATP